MVTSLGAVRIKTGAAPADPPSGEIALYSLDGSALLMRNSSGTITTFGSGGGGGGGTKISALAAGALTSTSEIVANVDGTTKKVVASSVKDFTNDHVASNPAAPAANTVRMFGRKVAGRMLPAFVGPSGLDSTVQASFARNKIAQFSAFPGATTLTATGMALSATGVATSKTPSSTSLYTQTKGVEFLVTTAATSAVAGWRSSIAAYWRGSRAGEGGFFFVCRFGLATGVATATRRAFVGLVASTSAPTDVNPSTQVNMCGMGLDATDSNWQFMTNDGSGTATKIDLGSGFARQTTDRVGVYELAMFCAPNGSEIFYECTDQTDGSVATGSVTTDLPAATTMLTQKGYVSVGGTSSVIGMMLSSLYIETDL